MRRWLWLSCLVTVLAPALLAAAEGPTGDQGPTLEYRPPRKVLPEPRQATPAPPVTLFREAFGSFGISEGAFDRPLDAVVDRDRAVFVLDAGNNRIQVFDRQSIFLFAWGSYGSRPGEFMQPSAIAFDPDGLLYVVDSGNDRIQIFSVDKAARKAELVGGVGGRGVRRGEFMRPLDLTFGEKNGERRMWVLDAGNERVQEFGARGGSAGAWSFVGEWGRLFGSRGGVFTDLMSIAWSSERLGYVYLVGGGCLVQQFDHERNLIRSFSGVAPESGLCVPARLEADNRYDYLYLLDAGNGLLLRFNRDGQLLAPLRGAERPFSKPRGFGLSEDGTEFVVADTGNNVVQRFTLR